VESVDASGDGRAVGVQRAGVWRLHSEVTGTELGCKRLIRIVAADPSIDVESAEAAAAPVADIDWEIRMLAAGQRSPRRYIDSLRTA